MQPINLQCNINEKTFSWTLFLTRSIVSLVLLYIVCGSLLYYREFLYNAAALGWPMPVQLGVALLLGQLVFVLMLLLGWFTRLVSGLSVLFMGAIGVIFFAGELNRIYVALMLLLITALLPSALLGPGKISLDYRQAARRANRISRG